MLSPVEWYFLASLGYPVVSVVHAFAKRGAYNAEIMSKKCTEVHVIEFRSQETSTKSPVYVGNQHLKVPVGGGSSTSWEKVGCGARIVGSTESIPKLNKYMLTLKAEKEFYVDTHYANNYEDIRPLLESYNMTNKIPVVLPMRIDIYKIPGPTVYFDKHIEYLDNNRARLLRTKMICQRLPLTAIVPLIALGAFGIGFGFSK